MCDLCVAETLSASGFEVCSTCHGYETLICAVCDGTGCNRCYMSGEVPCSCAPEPEEDDSYDDPS